MSFVRTITGDVVPGRLGSCYAHEHLIVDASYATHVFPDHCLNSVENAVKELSEFRDHGGSAMVEATPCGVGRNIRKLLKISERTGVKIIASTGLHHDKYYAPGHWSRFYTQGELVGLFVSEIRDGIDEYDFGGPLVKRSKARAGLIKMASSLGRLTGRERELFRVAARVHLQTGCPIMTHTEQGTAADEQIFLFREEGVELSRVMICHTDRKPEPDYHRKLLQAGVTLEYDSAFRWKGRKDNPTLELLKMLLPEFPDQIVLGMDAGRPSYWKHYNGSPGLSFLLLDFKEQLLECGLDQVLIRKLMEENPARVLSFSAVG